MRSLIGGAVSDIFRVAGERAPTWCLTANGGRADPRLWHIVGVVRGWKALVDIAVEEVGPYAPATPLPVDSGRQIRSKREPRAEKEP